MAEHDSSLRTARERSSSLAEKHATAGKWSLALAAGPQRDLLAALLKPHAQNLSTIREAMDEDTQVADRESSVQHRERSEDALNKEYNRAQKHRNRSEKMQEAIAVAGVAIGAVVLGEISISIAAAVQPNDDAEWARATAETVAWMVTVGFVSIPFWIWSFWNDSPWTYRTTLFGAMMGLWFGIVLHVTEHFITKLSWPPQIASPLLVDVVPLRSVLLPILGIALGLPVTALLCKRKSVQNLVNDRWPVLVLVGFIAWLVATLVLHNWEW